MKRSEIFIGIIFMIWILYNFRFTIGAIQVMLGDPRHLEFGMTPYVFTEDTAKATGEKR